MKNRASFLSRASFLADTVYGAVTLLLYFPLLIPLAPFLNPLYLLGNPPWFDRISSTLVSGYS
jgi:hypothetical protein